MPSAPPDRRAAVAAGLLRRVFASLEAPLTFRLWDGTTACVGSTGAWRLARAGARVTVLDAARFPRVKLCAGWVTPAALADLELDPSAYPHTIQPFSAVSVAVGDVEHETHWERTASYGIVRAEFDAFLVRRGAAAGVQVHQGARVREVREVPGGVEAASDAGTFTAGVVVGAARARLSGGARLRAHTGRGAGGRDAGERDARRCRAPARAHAAPRLARAHRRARLQGLRLVLHEGRLPEHRRGRAERRVRPPAARA